MIDSFTNTARLPGDPSPEIEAERAIRVDHAGEYGAVRIYEGQLAILKNRICAEKINSMAEQERGHLAIFEQLISERQVRPTILIPLWNIAGFAMGAGSALMGEKAAMACTEAVEEVIDNHYGRQIKSLYDHEPDLCATLAKCQADELEHKDLAIEAGAEDAPGYNLIKLGVTSATRLAIWLSERI